MSPRLSSLPELLNKVYHKISEDTIKIHECKINIEIVAIYAIIYLRANV